MPELPTRDEVRAMLAVIDELSTMGVDPVVRYPTLRRVLDAYVAGTVGEGTLVFLRDFTTQYSGGSDD